MVFLNFYRVWKTDSSVVNRTESGIAVEWLRQLWSYMIEHDCVQEFISDLHIVPIITPSTWKG